MADIKGIVRLVKRGLYICQSKGFGPFLGAVRRYLLQTTHQKIETRAVVRGERLFRFSTKLRHHVHRARYLAPASPYKLIQINPCEIDLMTGKFRPYLGLGQVKGGDWDRPENLLPVKEDWIYVGLKQRFEKGCDWEQTIYYEKMEQRFSERRWDWGYDSIDQFMRIRCAYVDDLFESIRSGGYRPNKAVKHDVPKEDRRNHQYDQRLEPLVAIGRNGEIFLRDGRHRFTIARILGIESIPANVLGRHSEWQIVRDELSKADLLLEPHSGCQSNLGHPDLQDMVTRTSI